MREYTYLIIGGGMTADAAVKGIRELDMSGSIGIISQEEFSPYDRPPLTKGLWFGKSVDTIWRKTELAHVSLHLKKRVASIDPQQHLVLDTSQETYRYQKLLIATGGTPKRLGCPDEGVIYYRTLNDYYHLRKLYDLGNDFVVIGSGYIGTEIAAALTMNGKNVTLIMKEPAIGVKKYPKKMASFLNAFFTEKGVRLICEQRVISVKKEKDKQIVKTDKGESFTADGVIAGLGITPNIELAQSINAKIDNGIVCDRYLKTNVADIWAAGDVANFYSPHLEKRLRIEHEDTANSMGKAAGRNMAGAKEEYSYLPFFYSDLFELGYEAIGEISSDLEIIEDWIEPYRHGALYYLKDQVLRGAMFWNLWNQIDKARDLIGAKQPFQTLS